MRKPRLSPIDTTNVVVESNTKTKPKRTIDPDSPAGIKNAWARAETRYRKAKEAVGKMTADVANANVELNNASAALTKVAAKVKALLPPEPKVPGA